MCNVMILVDRIIQLQEEIISSLNSTESLVRTENYLPYWQTLFIIPSHKDLLHVFQKFYSFGFHMHMIRVMSPDSGVCFCYCCCLVDACPIFLAPFKKNSPIHFVPFSKSIFQYMYMDIFLDSVLFHCSKYLSFCQYHILDYHAL